MVSNTANVAPTTHLQFYAKQKCTIQEKTASQYFTCLSSNVFYSSSLQVLIVCFNCMFVDARWRLCTVFGQNVAGVVLSIFYKQLNYSGIVISLFDLFDQKHYF